MELTTPAAWLTVWQARHLAPAFRPSSLRRPPGLIPRIIIQTAANRTLALSEYGKWMKTWWRLNPDYAYHLFVDADADDFVSRFCSESEKVAYRRSLVGAQRADLFRIYFLREVRACNALKEGASCSRHHRQLPRVAGRWRVC